MCNVIGAWNKYISNEEYHLIITSSDFLIGKSPSKKDEYCTSAIVRLFVIPYDERL